MPIDNVNPSSDDNQVTLLRKILTGFLKGNFSLSGGGGGGGGAVTVADGADVAQGTTTDAAAASVSGSKTAISLLKGIWNLLVAVQATLAGSLTVNQNTASLLNATVVQSTAANLNANVTLAGSAVTLNVSDSTTHTDLGATNGAQATDSISTWSINQLLKRIAGFFDGSASGVTALPVKGNIGGFTTVTKQRPTITSGSAYSSGNAVGTTLSFAAFRTAGTGVLESLTIIDTSNQSAPFTILFFDSALSGTVTDHSAFTFNASDFVRVIGRVNVAASDYVTTSTGAIAVKSGLGIALQNNESTTTLYAVVVTTGTPTYTATNALLFQLGILQD